MSDPHPFDDQLEEFLAGKLPEQDAGRVEAHLIDCARCVEKAATLSAHDAFVTLLSTASRCAAQQEAAAAEPGHQEIRTGTESTRQSAQSTCLTGETVTGQSDTLPEGLRVHPRYKVLQWLASGGMGTVWLAEHRLLERKVAIKVIRPELLARAEAVELFRREAKAVARLSSPYVVDVYDAEEAAGVHFLAMEYVRGENLDELLQGGALPLADACRAIRDAARGLAHAHAEGLVHRDIKPHNLIRSQDGTTKILDFGLSGLGEFVAGTGMPLVGTPDYMSPEQADHPQSASASSDIYSLGCTLYALLTGRPPFGGETVSAKLDAHRYHDLPAVPSAPPEIGRLLRRMTAKSPGKRLEANEVADQLDPFCSAHLPRRSSWTRRVGRRTVLAAATCGLVAGIVTWRSKLRNADSPESESAFRSFPTITARRVLRGHTRLVRWSVFSPDNRTIYSCGDDQLVRVWDVESGKEIGQWACPETTLCLALADSGRTLLSLSDSKLANRSSSQLKVWDVSTARERLVVPNPDGQRLACVAVHPDGQRAATLALNGSVHIWDVSNGVVKSDWSASQGLGPNFYYIAWSPEGQQLAVGGDHGLTLWNAETGVLIQGTPEHLGGQTGACFTPDGRRIAVAGWEGVVRVYDRDPWQSVYDFAAHPLGHAQAVSRAAVTPAVWWVGGCGTEATVWNLTQRKRLAQLVGHEVAINHVSLSPDGRLAATSSDDTTIRVWNLAALQSPAEPL